MDPVTLAIVASVGAKTAAKAVDDVLRPWLAKVKSEASADAEERQIERLRVLLTDRDDVEAAEADLRRLTGASEEQKDTERAA